MGLRVSFHAGGLQCRLCHIDRPMRPCRSTRRPSMRLRLLCISGEGAPSCTWLLPPRDMGFLASSPQAALGRSPMYRAYGEASKGMPTKAKIHPPPPPPPLPMSNE